MRVFFLIALGLLPLFAGAQQYPFIRITAPDGPQGCMVPFLDRSGGLWLAGCEGGSEGFFFYDGTRFVSPLKQPPKGIIRGLVEDTDGGIWLASSTGIYRFYKGQLQLKVAGVALAGIAQVAPDVFLATLNKSSADPLHNAALIRISRNQQDWESVAVQEPVEQVQYHLDHTGHLLFGCPEGYCEMSADEVTRWRPGASLTITRHAIQTGFNTQYAQNVSAVWKDRFGCVWWREHTTASYQCPSDSKPVNLPPNVASLGFPSFFELADGTVGIPSYGKLALGRPGNFRVLTPANGCPNTIMAIPGKDESLWITSTSGLFVLPLHVKMEFWSSRDGLSGPVWSIVRAGNKVFALSEINVRVLDEDRSHWRVLSGPAGRLLAGPNNTFFVAVTNYAMLQMTSDWKVLRKSPPIPTWLLARSPNGALWAGGTGVFRLDPTNAQYKVEPKAPDQKFVQGIQFDHQGALWTCSYSGLSRLLPAGWRTISTQDGLLQNGCGAMAEDQEGDFWYAYETIPGFALIHDPRSGHPVIQQFHTDGNRTYFVASDRRGWLWRGTPDGLYVSDSQQARQGEWVHLNRSDGLPAIDTNQNSFFEDADGSIWFGAEDSVIHIFPPNDMMHPGYSPSVFLSTFSVDGAPTQTAGLVDGLTSGKDVIAHLGSLQFDRRNAMQIRYRLLPEHPAWRAQHELDIHLGKLRPGNHTLEVQARLGAGLWSDTTTNSFAILRPLWLSWPALAGVAFIGSLGVTGSYRWRKKLQARSARTLPALAEWRLAALSPEISQLVGKVLDSRFEVGPVLTRGGFATIAKGKDLQQDHRPCAIKIFRQDLTDQAWMTRRFEQEVRALEKVVHPNVVRIYGHGITRVGAQYLAMEFIEGETLREKLERGPLTSQQTASYLRQTGSALDEIHRRGICHRDLKPENLMIRNGATDGHDLVLIDFSIAIVQDPDVTLHGLSRAAGTIYYMAPEQSIGYADSSTDIYSLAKIIIEMLTGQRLSTLLPDASMDLSARVREFVTDPNFNLSSASIDLISSALEFDPSHRPKDARAFSMQIANDLASVSNKV